jgi:hypothetical protein
MTSIAGLTPAAVHEAGHIVVACALGRRVTLIRLGRRMVPADHPHAELLQGSITGGESRFAPALATDINHRVETGIPLNAVHLEWLRAELVTCFAGALAETRLLGEKRPESELAELTASVEQVAATLSQGPCEFDEASAHPLLKQSGVSRGTHREWLEELGA